MTTIFTLECLVKIILFGLLFNGKSSYLRLAWNVMDFIIVLFAIISATPFPVELSIFKIFRMLRVLRPLRMIPRNPGLKIAVQSLINAVPGIGNLMVISTLVLMLFAILGVTFFKGKMHYCYIENIPQDKISEINNWWECLDYGGEWV